MCLQMHIWVDSPRMTVNSTLHCHAERTSSLLRRVAQCDSSVFPWRQQRLNQFVWLWLHSLNLWGGIGSERPNRQWNTLLGASRCYPQVKKPFVWSELNSSLGVVLYMLESISNVFWSPSSGIHVNSWVWSEQSVHLFSSLLSFRNLTQSDVHIPNICGSSREALPLTHGLRFYGNRVLLLSLSETGLQQCLDLLLARPQTVLKGEEFRLIW